MLTHTTCSRLAVARPRRAFSRLATPSSAVCRPVVMRAQTGDDSEAMGKDNWEQQPHENAFSEPKSGQQGNAVFDVEEPKSEQQGNAEFDMELHIKSLEGVAPKASDSMLQDSWEPATDKLPEGAQVQEVTWKEQDLKQGKMEPSADEASSPKDQPMGTEYGQAAEERSSGSGADTGRSQEMSSQGADQAQGGRFDEEATPGDHPYDPRPRERGHGVPPHKDASNTHAPDNKSA